jgi:hypothetical protein
VSETNFAGVLQVLTQANVDFILIGGVAAIAHGCARATFDIDVVYSREARSAQALPARHPCGPAVTFGTNGAFRKA